MFERIFVEHGVLENPRTQNILAKLSRTPVTYIEKVEDVFGRVYKPYLQKNTNLNLFLGQKKGQLIKPAPPAYGLSGAPHYYFVHAYNCIYECQYCYLQGYFKSPDIVLFVNHEEICDEISALCNQTHSSDKEVWFHAGEFSDSLALSGLTQEWPLYWETFSKLKNGYLELRTKSNNIRSVVDLPPLDNVIISFSLSPAAAIEEFDLKTPPLAARLLAMKKLASRGHKIGVHLDPIIYNDSMNRDYDILLEQLLEHVPEPQIKYISLGVVRFTKDVYQCVKKNYPRSRLHAMDFEKSFDEKVRYPETQRQHVLNAVKKIALSKGLSDQKLYFCMEE